MKSTIVIVPGYTNSGPLHWQTLLEHKFANVVRINQLDWENPVREQWIKGLNNTLEMSHGNIILVGHSCGAVTIAQWAEHYENNHVKGALLVAPADVDATNAISPIHVQRPLPKSTLPFPSILVSSDNDPHITLEKSKELAACWGSEFVVIAGGGHIHTDSGFGEWPDCELLINKLSGILTLK